jgi:hypothetical protein
MGHGDPKASLTTGWNSNGEEAWRRELTDQQKAAIRAGCGPVFAGFGYDPDDDSPC